jgi:hypothetical protein
MGVTVTMKLKVDHLRVLLLLVNVVVLPGSLAGYYVYSLWPTPATTGVKIYPRAALEYRPARAAQASLDPVAYGKLVADQITPEQRPTAPEKPQQPVAVPEEAPTPGGPLAANWEYDWALLFPGDPASNVVRLSRKTPQGRAVRSPIRSPRTGRGFRRQRGRGDAFTFRIKEHHVQRDELALDFHAHSATRDEFTYWVDDPGKLFSLPRVSPFRYSQLKEPVDNRGRVR